MATKIDFQPIDFQPEESSKESAPLDLGKAASNVLPSAVDYAKNVSGIVTSPVETVKGITNVASGALVKGAKAVGLPVPEERMKEEDVQAFNAVANFYKDRYGSVEDLKRAIESDPVGVASDLSAVLGGGSAAAKGAGLAKTAKGLDVASKITDPLSAVKGVVKGTSNVLKSGAENLYESALKVPPSIPREQRLAAINQGLELKVPLSEKGAVKINERIADLGDKMSGAINEAAKAGKKVTIDRVFSPLNDLRSFYDNAIGTASDISWLDDFMEAEKSRLTNKYGGNTIPINEAQKLKQNTYRLLKNKYGELKSVEIEAQKQVARGLRQEIEQELIDTHPELQQLNKEQGKLIDLSSFIDRALNRTSNYDILRLTNKAGAAAGGALGGKTGAIVGAIASSISDNPAFKSYLALGMNKASKAGRDIAFKSGARQAAFQTGRAGEVANDPNANRSDFELNIPDFVNTAGAADYGTYIGNQKNRIKAIDEAAGEIQGSEAPRPSRQAITSGRGPAIDSSQAAIDKARADLEKRKAFERNLNQPRQAIPQETPKIPRQRRIVQVITNRGIRYRDVDTGEEFRDNPNEL